MKPTFYLYHNKFQKMSGKAIDCFIRSWGLESVEKEIAMFKRKKYMEQALKYLKKSNQILEEVTNEKTIK